MRLVRFKIEKLNWYWKNCTEFVFKPNDFRVFFHYKPEVGLYKYFYFLFLVNVFCLVRAKTGFSKPVFAFYYQVKRLFSISWKPKTETAISGWKKKKTEPIHKFLNRPISIIYHYICDDMTLQM